MARSSAQPQEIGRHGSDATVLQELSDFQTSGPLRVDAEPRLSNRASRTSEPTSEKKPPPPTAEDNREHGSVLATREPARNGHRPTLNRRVAVPSSCHHLPHGAETNRLMAKMKMRVAMGAYEAVSKALRTSQEWHDDGSDKAG